jgi:V8-like Glu-specific endopeptidase
MKSLQSLLLVAALGFALAAKAAENARQIASATFPSVVLLVMEDERGQPVTLGSGFFVKEKVIASNFHVVEKASRGYAKLVGQKTKYSIAGVVGLDAKHDLVLLAVEDATAPALKLGDGSKVAVGDTVFAVGNPQGLEGTFSQGIVSGIRQFDADSLLQITAPISPGSSGGPVVDSEGKVIGVAVATFKGGQNLNFAIPAKHVHELLQKAGKPEPLASKTTKGTKSILDELGGSKSTDGVTAGTFTYDDSWQFGRFSFSLVNQLRELVKNVYCLLVFFDTAGSPIDVQVVQYPGTIPAGLAKRVKGKVEESVEKLNCPLPGFELYYPPPRKPKGKIEFRILNFEVVE